MVLGARGDGAGDEGRGGVRNQLGESSVGAVVQAGTVYGGIHIRNASVEDKPWHLPPVGRITDRRGELAALERCRVQAAHHGYPALAAISGLGGVGKTMLALSWLHGLRAEFPDGQLYVDLGAQSGRGAPADPMEILGRFLRALGVPPGRVPRAEDERAGVFRSLTASRRLVLLLDDAATAAQVRPLLPGGRSVVVVTSRWRLPGLSVDGCHFVRLEPLDTDAAVELLASTLADDRVRTQLDDARALVKLCAGLPLAVRVAGARLAARPRRRITVMVSALAEEKDRLEALAIDGDRGVRAALDLSYEGLPSAAARLYRRLALHPGPDFTSEVAAAVLGVEGSGHSEVPRLLDALHDANLLTDAGDERYRFHDLVRLHAVGKGEADEAPAERAAALRRIFDHYLATATRAEEILDPHHRSLPRDYGPGPVVVEDFGDHGGDEGEAALAWLERELPNLMEVLKNARRAGCATVTWQLADAMWSLFMRRKHYEEWRQAHGEGAAAARESADTAAECRMLTSGAMGELDMGNYARALESFERAARLFEDAGDEIGFARTLNYRGLAHQALGRLTEAEALFQRAAVELPRCGDLRAGGLARFNLAEVALAEGRHDTGLVHAESAYRVLLEEGDSYNAARAARVIGRAHLALGRMEEAEERLAGALAALRPVSDFEAARTLEALAELAEQQGRRDLSRARHQEALALYETLGLPAMAGAVRDRLDRASGGASE